MAGRRFGCHLPLLYKAGLHGRKEIAGNMAKYEEKPLKGSVIMIIWRNMLDTLTDLFFPGSQPCLFCGTEMAGQGGGGFCPACKEQVFALAEELGQCTRCGTFTRSSVCPNCWDWEKQLLSRVTAVAPYQGFYRELIMSLKSQGREEVAEILGKLMAEKAWTMGILSQVQVVMPVPLHPSREMERGYNQSRWLAVQVARRGGIPLNDTALVRVSHDSKQSVLGRRARIENMAGAFRCREESKIKGKSVLLVDDIITTGSTLLSCAIALRNSGAGAVYGLTWAAGVEKGSQGQESGPCLENKGRKRIWR